MYYEREKGQERGRKAERKEMRWGGKERERKGKKKIRDKERR